jgi:hypothetical protein
VELWSYLLAALALFISWQIGRKKAWAWLVAAITQLLWVVYALVTKQYGFVASALAFFVMNWCNYVKWRREEVKAREVQDDWAVRVLDG